MFVTQSTLCVLVRSHHDGQDLRRPSHSRACRFKRSNRRFEAIDLRNLQVTFFFPPIGAFFVAGCSCELLINILLTAYVLVQSSNSNFSDTFTQIQFGLCPRSDSRILVNLQADAGGGAVREWRVHLCAHSFSNDFILTGLIALPRYWKWPIPAPLPPRSKPGSAGRELRGNQRLDDEPLPLALVYQKEGRSGFRFVYVSYYVKH